MSNLDLDDEVFVIFLEESEEQLESLEKDFLELESNITSFDSDLINRIFRAVHTIKGGSSFFSLDKLTKLAHAMENLLDLIRQGEHIPHRGSINVLLDGADLLRAMIDVPAEMESVVTESAVKAIQAVINEEAESPEEETGASRVEIAYAGHPPIFTVDKADIVRLIESSQGVSLFLVEFDLLVDFTEPCRDVITFINAFDDSIVLVDCSIDLSQIPDPRDNIHDMKMPFFMLISSVKSSEELAVFLESNTEKIITLAVDTLDSGRIDVPGRDVNQPKDNPVDTAGLSVTKAPTVKPVPATTPTPEPTSFVAAKVSQPVEDKSTVAAPQIVAKSLPNAVPPPARKPETTELPSQDKASSIDKSAKELPTKSSGKKAEGSVRVNVRILDNLMSLAEELVLTRNQLLLNTAEQQWEALPGTAQKVDLITAEMQDAIMSTRMQTLGVVLGKFKRIVRDMSRDLGKEVELVLVGEEVELDKSIIEEIGAPLTHLVRNSMDHGLEMPGERQANGKPRQGTLKISAFHEAGQVNLIISDDGGGIDPERIKAKALSSGLCTSYELEQMSKQEVLKLIFRPGFSTAEVVSDISGRGVGMDVVQSNLTKLGGTIDIDSTVGKGTNINIKLPLTLAIIQSLRINIGSSTFAIPQVNLLELVRLSQEEAAIQVSSLGSAKLIRRREQLLPLVYLSEVLNLPEPEAGPLNIVVVAAGDMKYGLVVDTLQDSSEIVVKPLGYHFQQCNVYAGATILGDGNIALILDIMGIASLCNLSSIAEKVAVSSGAGTDELTEESEKQSLLLVKDSPSEFLAIPLPLVSRIEKVKADTIEIIAGRQSVPYRDSILPIVTLAEIGQLAPCSNNKFAKLIVFKACGREVGLRVSEVVDIVTDHVNIEPLTYHQHGLLGSTVLNKHITLIIDLFDLIKYARPDWEVAPLPNSSITIEGVERKKTILLAEDSPFFRKQLASILIEAGYLVIQAEDGLEAYSLLSENSVQIDLIITDIEMPNMNGFEFSTKVRTSSQYDALPIFAVTCLSGDKAEKQAQDAGMDAYLLKLDKEQVLTTCHHFFENGRQLECTK